MKIDIITLFPEMFKGPFSQSIVKRAIEKSKLILNIHNLRNWALDKRGTVDGRPYGGGTGMLLRPEPIFKAVEALKNPKSKIQNPKQVPNSKSKIQNNTIMSQQQQSSHPAIQPSSHIILLDAGGKLYNQQTSQRLSKLEHIILICGHYEGVDYRVHEHLANEIISIGDYVLTGGEIPAMVLVDSITRLLPGVLDPEATENESFSRKFEVRSSKFEVRATKSLVEYPQYTRPPVFRRHKVPQVLLSGKHQEIEKWRMEKALERTKQNRPDLLNL